MIAVKYRVNLETEALGRNYLSLVSSLRLIGYFEWRHDRSRPRALHRFPRHCPLRIDRDAPSKERMDSAQTHSNLHTTRFFLWCVLRYGRRHRGPSQILRQLWDGCEKSACEPAEWGTQSRANTQLNGNMNPNGKSQSKSQAV